LTPDGTAPDGTAPDGTARCVLCGHPATERVDPPRRTLFRGTDPRDPSYSVTVILPDVALCSLHAAEVRSGDLHVGWCDDAQCQRYGALGGASPCGAPFEKLVRPR